ncbi:hypothetical protein [Lyngbya confervoides]|uniref:Uncharacterized protein n=1 Tax=Lyngbya confervoides BDU141951 TaxID=1574623 RepID=A0ABD4SYI0_9CYAN|nr:hypothetical protein [Lyngbya confervoides]MCM1981225.1 hypothetical protein [Lyngbya confervoides BDU141951]
MNPKRYLYTTWISIILILAFSRGQWGVVTQVVSEVPALRPEAGANLATPEGVALMKTAWRYSDAQIVEVGFNEPGADRRPSGPANRTYDSMPHAGAANFGPTQTRFPRG